MSSYVDWMLDDITWCARECDCKDCFRNLKNRKLKGGMISVGDMYKEGECPKTSKLPKRKRKKSK
jgi:hypothetical protein